MKSRNIILICSALAACAADPDPDRLDAQATGGTGGPGDARNHDALNGDALSADASLPGPDADLRPNCVAPVDGACPDDIEQVLYGSMWDPEDGCWRRVIITCLYNVGGAAGEETKCREDGTPFWVPTITCRPFASRQCTAAELEAAPAVRCPEE